MALLFRKKGGLVSFTNNKVDVIRFAWDKRVSPMMINCCFIVCFSTFHTRPRSSACTLLFEQLGVPTAVLRVKHIHNGQKYLCQLDEVGHWYSVSNGSRVRECNFNQVLMRAIQNGGWVTTFDEDTSPVTFDKIRKIFDEFGSLTVYD